MSDHNHVTMNIPDTNPLFDWAWNAARGDAAIPYVNIRVGDISARLQLREVTGIEHVYEHADIGDGLPPTRASRAFLETSWRLLRDNT